MLSNQKLPITVAIISLNEEKNIARCIQSVPWASEVLVIDSNSTDRTVDIAKSLGARVHLQDFLGFRKQKQLATDMATQDWVLSLDADEALSDELSNELIEKFSSLDKNCAYAMPRLSFHMGKWIRHGGWHPDYQTRLFHRKHSSWGGGNVHEKIECRRRIFLKNNILHWVFRDLYHQVEANNKYSTLGAQDLIEKGKKFSIFRFFVKPVSKFIECYFLKRGFLDGIPGFIIAVGAAYSVFLKFSKLYELKIGEQKK